MNANLMDMAKDYLSPDIVKKFGTQLGETPDATQKGLSSAVPAVMGGFVRQATSDPTGAGVSRLLMAGRNGEKIDDPSSFIGKGQSMLGSLFGDRLPSAVDHVAHSSGLSQKSAGKVLAMAAPIVGAVIGREASTRRLGPTGLASMLAGQRGAVASALGAGGLASLFGGGAEMAERPGETAHYRTVTPEGKPAGRRIGMPFILLGVLVFLALLMLFGRRRPTLGTTMPDLRAVPHAQAPKAPPVQAPTAPPAPAPT